MSTRRASPDGVLLLDKPAGITSTRALAKAKRLLASLKAGHTGTLDPFATGLLPLAFGEATKFSRFLIDARKSYHATLRLGEETPTGDIESPVTTRKPVAVDDCMIADVLASFVGIQGQIPPMHSAVHVAGRRLYDYARSGEEVERASRQVEIIALRALGRHADDLAVEVTCSKGTYVRTLAQDIGRALGCGAHLVALRRTAVGPFGIEAAVTFEQLEAAPGETAARLLAPEALVAGLARFEASSEQAERFVHGRAIEWAAGTSLDEVAVYGPGARFLGVGSCGSGERIVPLRLMSPPQAKSPDFA